MSKRFATIISVFALMVGLVGMTQASTVVAAPGNNGTIKIGGIDADSDDNSNYPHIDGCSLDVKFYGYDEGARSATITFESQAPTLNTLVSPTGAQNFNFVGGGDGGQLDATATYNLAFQGAPQQNQGYHVKVTVHADGSKGNDTKFKVFWVEGCTGTSNYQKACESLTLLKPTTSPANATYQYYLDDEAISLGTHDVEAGVHTLILKVNGITVDTDIVSIEECSNEEGEPNVSASLACNVTTKTFTMTITNSGDASSKISLNGEEFTLGAGESVDKTIVDNGEGVTIELLVDGVVYGTGDNAFDGTRPFFCKQGNGGGETPTTPGNPTTTNSVASLPVTGGVAPLVSLIAILSTVVAAAASYLWQNRAGSQL